MRRFDLPKIWAVAVSRGVGVYQRLTKTVTLGVRAVVLDDAGRVFLVKHSYIAGWYLPGGGVEIGESLMTALVRELQEEGNLSLTEAPQLFGMYFNRRVSRRDYVALYVVRNFQQGALEPNHEIIDHGFFAVDNLPGDATASTRSRIEEVLKGRKAAEIW